MVAKKTINIVHLYPKELNIYGDNGNTQTLVKRLQWRGYKARVTKVGIGQELPKDTDIIVAGGGQDVGQFDVERDLHKKAHQLQAMANSGVTMLVICGMYQLFGHKYITHDQRMLRGISILDVITVAKDKRLIGNVVVKTPWGEIVGFENHSGQTELGAGQLHLGEVIKGYGNNQLSGYEGAVKNNVFGSYLHGPILPKNPEFADELLRRALERKFGSSQLEKLDDSLELKAQEVAKTRP